MKKEKALDRNHRLIYLLTMQHTGTWFIISFLYNHPKVSGFVELNKLQEMLEGGKGLHYNLDSSGINSIKANLNGSGVGIIHCHVRMSNLNLGKMEEHQLALMMAQPTIIPLRDPLLSLLTSYQRIPNRSYTSHLAEWKAFVDGLNQVMEYQDIYFLPIDLLRQPVEKYFALSGALKFLGIPNNDYAKKWLVEWPVYNTCGDYELKRRYYAGDKSFIEKTMPEEWEMLCALKDNMKPFFEQIGYRELLWW